MGTRTRDRGAFYIQSKLGPKQSVTPEGFLLCEDVPIARTGEMIYGPKETPVTPGPDGLVHIVRDPAEVFRPETIASINGKPVVDGHPSDDVTPLNYRALACGHALNPRQGTGAQADELLADLIVTCPNLIAEIREGKREVSLGYDAEYYELGPGKGRQANIVVNHVALVDKGRCGPRCSIGDQKQEIDDMKTRDEKPKGLGQQVLDALRAAFKAKDEAAFEKAVKDCGMDEMNSGVVGGAEEGTHFHVHMPGGGSGEAPARDANEERFAGIEKRMDSMEELIKGLGKGADADEDEDEDDEEKEAKKKAEDEKLEAMEGETGKTKDQLKATKDSSFFAEAFQNTTALAEILMPGISLPKFEAKDPPTKTFDAMCNLRRSTLDAAYKIADTKAMIDEVVGKPLNLQSMTCDAVRSVFLAAGALKKRANKGGTQTADNLAKQAKQAAAPIVSAADLNKRHREFYKPKSSSAH